MNKAIKYRLYPTTEQATMFAKTFGCCRKVYNLMLADKISSYEETGKFAKVTPAKYKEEYPFLKEVDSLALANEQLNLQSAFHSFFDKTRKKRNGFPKYKSAKKCRKSYTTNNQKGTVAVTNNCIKLPKIGKVKAKIHRIPNEDWILKSATVSQDSDGKYYASVLFEFDASVETVAVTDNAIGLDYSSAELYVDSNGEIGSNHKYYHESQTKLAKAQRKLRHMTVGSSNYKKQQKKIAAIYKRTANQRNDNLHKLSTKIANSYDVVCVESLDMKNMSRTLKLGKATMDNGYGMFLNMLEYKLTDRGKHFVKVDKWFPSTQLCSSCGAVHKLGLKDRLYKCECGLVIDRDINAAINIKNEGLRILRSA